MDILSSSEEAKRQDNNLQQQQPSSAGNQAQSNLNLNINNNNNTIPSSPASHYLEARFLWRFLYIRSREPMMTTHFQAQKAIIDKFCSFHISFASLDFTEFVVHLPMRGRPSVFKHLPTDGLIEGPLPLATNLKDFAKAFEHKEGYRFHSFTDMRTPLPVQTMHNFIMDGILTGTRTLAGMYIQAQNDVDSQLRAYILQNYDYYSEEERICLASRELYEFDRFNNITFHELVQDYTRRRQQLQSAARKRNRPSRDSRARRPRSELEEGEDVDDDEDDYDDDDLEEEEAGDDLEDYDEDEVDGDDDDDGDHIADDNDDDYDVGAGGRRCRQENKQTSRRSGRRQARGNPSPNPKSKSKSKSKSKPQNKLDSSSKRTNGSSTNKKSLPPVPIFNVPTISKAPQAQSIQTHLRHTTKLSSAGTQSKKLTFQVAPTELQQKIFDLQSKQSQGKTGFQLASKTPSSNKKIPLKEPKDKDDEEVARKKEPRKLIKSAAK